MTFHFVFEARIKPGCTEEQYVDAWRSGSAIIQGEPGALGTRLHRNSAGVLVAIATWESKAARDAAIKELGLDGDIVDNTDSVLRSHLQFADVTPLFGLEEIAAMDPPKPRSSRRSDDH
jgi:hypothetical protein